MSFHEMHRLLWPKLDPARVAELVHADNLATARVEPTYSQRREAYLDLGFEKNGAWIFVPLLRVEGLMLLTRENPPIAWPETAEGTPAVVLRAIEERVLPWLRSLATARYFNHEETRIFRGEPSVHGTFEAARASGFYGAAPYRTVLPLLGPGVYAQRFARERTVAIAGPSAGNALAVLSSVARECAVEQSELSARWFGGIASVPLDASRTYDCYVGPRDDGVNSACSVFEGETRPGEREVIVTEPIPMDVTVSFDPEDAPVRRSFAVTERVLNLAPSILQRPAANGGSAGSIRLVVRDDAEKFPDADYDAARALARALCAEGFDAVVSPAKSVDPASADIIHVFGLRHGAGLVELLRDAEGARVPVVVTPYADDRDGEAVLGAHAGLALPRGTVDPETLQEYYWALARRRISNLTSGTLYDDASMVLMMRAAAALVTCAAEEAFLRERFAFNAPAVISPPAVDLCEADAAIGSVIGSGEYILMHAPLEPAAGQLTAIHAARRARLPLLLLGPVQNIEYFRYITDVAGPTVTLLRDAPLSDGQIEAIYARARVIADVGPTSRGLERLARGMAHGAAPVAPKSGYARELWGDLVAAVDPLDIATIEASLARAWERRPADAAAFAMAVSGTAGPERAVLAAVRAYAQAAGTLVS